MNTGFAELQASGSPLPSSSFVNDANRIAHTEQMRSLGLNIWNAANTSAFFGYDSGLFAKGQNSKVLDLSPQGSIITLPRYVHALDSYGHFVTEWRRDRYNNRVNLRRQAFTGEVGSWYAVNTDGQIAIFKYTQVEDLQPAANFYFEGDEFPINDNTKVWKILNPLAATTGLHHIVEDPGLSRDHDAPVGTLIPTRNTYWFAPSSANGHAWNYNAACDQFADAVNRGIFGSGSLSIINFYYDRWEKLILLYSRNGASGGYVISRGQDIHGSGATQNGQYQFPTLDIVRGIWASGNINFPHCQGGLGTDFFAVPEALRFTNPTITPYN